MLRSLDWWLGTDVSGQAVGLSFKDKAVKVKMGLTGSAETSVTNHQSTLHKSQKSEDIIFTAAVARNHARLWLYISKLRHRQLGILTFRHRASCILGQAFHYSPENAFLYI